MTISRRITFPPRGDFLDILKQRVDDYFTQQKISSTGNAFLYFKTLFGYSLVFFSYYALVWQISSPWMAILATIVLAQGYVFIAFNVMHDGAHGSYSKSKKINWLMGATMDFVGGSNILWRQKHNLLHHTYTNIDGKDDDIAIGALMRLSPNQKHYPWHRWQHFYAPFLYSLLSLFIMLYSDFRQIFTGKIGDTPMQKFKKWEKPYFFIAKITYFTYTLIIPSLYHPFWLVLLVFISMHLMFGLILSLVFQLAHTVEGTEFPMPDGEKGMMQDEWAIHQLKTTADFAPNSFLTSFYVGGLNFQVEHHLFHRVSHVHYPALNRIVQQTCQEFHIPYLCFPTVLSALKAHFCFLKRMGQATH